MSSTTNPSSEASTPAPEQSISLTLVHIIGTKYIDYFTDGSTTIPVPGDPKIDADFDKPDAPIPTHAGMTWVHSTGQDLYDTPTGDLDVGDYALVNGAFSVHYAASTYTDATPTSQWPNRIVSGLTKDPVTGAAAPTSEPATTDTEPAAAQESSASSAPETSMSGSVLGASTSSQDAQATSASSSDSSQQPSDSSTSSEPAPLPDTGTTSTTTP
jgi:hypothetical protein